MSTLERETPTLGSAPGSRAADRRTIVAATAFVVAALALCGALFVQRVRAEERPRYHRQVEPFEKAFIDTVRSILRGDPSAARVSLDRMVELSPPLVPEDRDSFGGDFVAADRSLQVTLTNTREYATRGDLDELFNEFVWVQRTCLHCHGLAGVRATGGTAP